MSKRTIRGGIVGSGYAASFHFDAARKVHGAHVESDSALAADCVAVIYAACVSNERKGAEVVVEPV